MTTPAASAEPLTEARVREALRGVLDPELDRSIVDLGFVYEVNLTGRDVQVDLRLPTYWCSPNFSWLMVWDAREAVRALPGVGRVSVALLDHHAAAEVTEGVNAGRSFEEAFAGHTTGGLEDLRRSFRRKAFLVRQERALQPVARSAPANLKLKDLPPSPETDAYLAIRGELGLDCAPEAPAVTDAEGRAVKDVDAHIRHARLVRISLESNTALCRGLFEARYGGREASGGSR